MYATADSIGQINGFDGLVNGRERIWVAPGSRIYPSALQLWINRSQDLCHDVVERFPKYPCGELFEREAGRDEFGDLQPRILSALQWYARSCPLNVDENLEIAALAIAFESLLDLEQGPHITDKFKEVVTTLCGRINALDGWLTQFYDCRSSVMHKGRTSSVMYNPAWTGKKDNKSAQLNYRSLVSYGRHIFHICLSAILSGTGLANRLGLAKLFVPNHRRITKLCEILSHSADTPTDCFAFISPLVREIETFRFVPDTGITKDMLLTASKLVAGKLASVPGIDNDLAADASALANAARESDHYQELHALRKLVDKWNLHAFRDGGDPKDLAACIFGITWLPHMGDYYDARMARHIHNEFDIIENNEDESE